MDDNTTLVQTLLIGAVIGLIPAYIAHRKGSSFVAWWFFGAILFIVALPAAIWGVTPDPEYLQERRARDEARRMRDEGLVKCPHCTELVKREAAVCRFCQRALPPQT